MWPSSPTMCPCVLQLHITLKYFKKEVVKIERISPGLENPSGHGGQRDPTYSHFCEFQMYFSLQSAKFEGMFDELFSSSYHNDSLFNKGVEGVFEKCFSSCYTVLVKSSWLKHIGDVLKCEWIWSTEQSFIKLISIAVDFSFWKQNLTSIIFVGEIGIGYLLMKHIAVKTSWKKRKFSKY